MTSAVSFDSPKLCSILVDDADRNMVNIHGQNLAFSPSARIRGTACTEIKWFSDSSVCCSFPNQVSSDVSIRVSMFQSVGTLTEAVASQTHFHLSTASLSNTPKIRHAVPVILHGSALGLSSLSASATLGLSSAEFTSWISESSVKAAFCVGEQQSSRMSLSIFSRSFSFSDLVSYDNVLILGTSSTNLPTTGQRFISHVAINFGMYSTSHQARLGGSANEAGSWISDTTVSSLSSRGARIALPVVMTVSRQLSSGFRAVSFDAAKVHLSTAGNVPVKTCEFTIKGANFVMFSLSQRPRLGTIDVSYLLPFSSCWVSLD